VRLGHHVGTVTVCYTQKAPDHVSWYRPHLKASIALIEQNRAGPSASLIDVGAGEFTLVDDLLARYSNLPVLDTSQAAIATCRKRLGYVAERVRWLVANITKAELELSTYDLWHDRAVFHFLHTLRIYTTSISELIMPGESTATPSDEHGNRNIDRAT